MSIGDWSADGHGNKKEYKVSSDKSVEEVREDHFGIETTLGFKIDSIVNKYEVEAIKPEQMLELLRIEGFKENFSVSLASGGYDENKINWLIPFLKEDPDTEDMYEDEFEFHPTPKLLAEIWIYLINKVDPDLNLKLIQEENIPSLHFYGVDEKGRHINQVGYGLFQ